jgi:anti-sigma regulatory factor (Ser/Thr protein kinase)
MSDLRVLVPGKSFDLEPREMEAARNTLAEALRAALPSHDWLVTDAVIAAGEVLQNIVRHERPGPSGLRVTMSVSIDEADGRLMIDMRDTAAPLLSLAFLHQRHEAGVHGGMGIELVRSVSETYRIAPLSDGNLHQMVLLTRPDRASGPSFS